MPSTKTNRFPLRNANYSISAETSPALFGDGTPSLASRIPPIERQYPRGLPVAEIDKNSDQECIIDEETDEHETNNKDNDDSEDVVPPAPLRPNIIIAHIVGQ